MSEEKLRLEYKRKINRLLLKTKEKQTKNQTISSIPLEITCSSIKASPPSYPLQCHVQFQHICTPLLLHHSHISITYLFIITALRAKICHEVCHFAQTALLINIHCNELCSHLGSLASVTPSIPDPHLDLDENIIRYLDSLLLLRLMLILWLWFHRACPFLLLQKLTDSVYVDVNHSKPWILTSVVAEVFSPGLCCAFS